MLDISTTPLRSRPTPEQFITIAEEAVQGIFRDFKEVRPMAVILPGEGSVIYYAFPNFNTDETKDASMMQIRYLTKLLDCVGYVFASEAWFSVAKSKEDLQFASDLNYRISMMPERKEGLILNQEYKVGGKAIRQMVMWEVHRNPNRLENKQTMPNGGEGRMMNILKDD